MKVWRQTEREKENKRLFKTKSSAQLVFLHVCAASIRPHKRTDPKNHLSVNLTWSYGNEDHNNNNSVLHLQFME